MDDTATYGSPSNGASPDSNPILAQPPLRPDSGAGDREGKRIVIDSGLIPNMLLMRCRCPNVRGVSYRVKH
jgi:hypothetical protein